jgi:hypothetical protein
MTKKAKLVLLLALFLQVLNVKAQLSQEEVKRRYESETIYTVYNQYYKGGEKHRMGFYGRRMKHEFEISPEALQSFQKYRRQALTGHWIAVAGIVANTSALIFINEEQQPGLFWAIYAPTLAVGITGLAIELGAQKHLSRAIWLRNRDVLLSPRN